VFRIRKRHGVVAVVNRAAMIERHGVVVEGREGSAVWRGHENIAASSQQLSSMIAPKLWFRVVGGLLTVRHR
jgi:hypothetical protein